MEQKNIDYIMQTLESIQKLRDDARDTHFNEGFQLLMAQMDLFKTLSTLVIGLAAISYIYEKDANLDYLSLIFAGIFGILTLLLSTSGIREKIDIHAKINENNSIMMQERVHKLQQKALEARRLDNFNIFEKYIQEEMDRPKPEKEIPEYLGEFMVFLFYTGFSFLILAFILPKIQGLCFITKIVYYLGVILVSFLISFKDWFEPLFTKIINPFFHKIWKKNT